jgi:hypothetical protein
MTPEEQARIEREQLSFSQGLSVLKDQLIVTNRMVEENDKRWWQQTHDLWDYATFLTHALQDLRQTVDNLAARQATTQAALDSLITHIDRFIQGHGGNGDRQS